MKHLFYGDNLAVLRGMVRMNAHPTGYREPQVNSNAGCNVLFRGRIGNGGTAEVGALDDTWRWPDSVFLKEEAS